MNTASTTPCYYLIHSLFPTAHTAPYIPYIPPLLPVVRMGRPCGHHVDTMWAPCGHHVGGEQRGKGKSGRRGDCKRRKVLVSIRHDKVAVKCFAVQKLVRSAHVYPGQVVTVLVGHQPGDEGIALLLREWFLGRFQVEP